MCEARLKRKVYGVLTGAVSFSRDLREKMMWNRVPRSNLSPRAAGNGRSDGSSGILAIRFSPIIIAFPVLALMAALGFPAEAIAAQDSLYRECDTVPRGRSPRYVNLRTEPDAGCESTVPCGALQEASRNLPDGGVETYHFRMRGGDTLKDGTFEIRDRLKRIKQQGSYAAGKRSGEWVAWYPNGKRRTVEHFREGKREGLHREYSSKGRLVDEFKYREGTIDCLDGYHRSWYHNGKLKFEMLVQDRKLTRYVFFDSLGKELDLPVILK